MPDQKIVIKIDPQDGSMKIKTDGFTGDACLTTLQSILGSMVQLDDYQPLPEFHKDVQVKTNQKIEVKK